MDSIRIVGGTPLRGTVEIGGAKNAALPLMVASLLTDQPLALTNVPAIVDTASMAELLGQHGVGIERSGRHGWQLRAREIASTTAPYDIVRKMRASFLVLGPLLARCGTARVSLPGGCAIGPRPVELHLQGLRQMGAEITIDAGYVEAKVAGRLRGAEIVFPFASVGATENLLMAASLAEGETVLVNAAREPEIVDLATCLTAMGAVIEGAGSDRIVIHGRPRLDGAGHRVISDRIEAGTYMIAAAITGGRLNLKGAGLAQLPVVVTALGEAGVSITDGEDGVEIACDGTGRLQGTDVMTEPYPGFPTDLQAQMMALMSVASGAAMITETIFENRFMHVPELMRMGANITVHNASALVRGVPRLRGAPVMATDLRASVSLVLAGLAAEGETIVSRVYHLDRGFESIEAKLADCGADIRRVKG